MLTGSRQGNQSQVLKLRMLREMPSNLVTAHIGQFEIHQQDRGHEVEGESKSSLAGVRDARITASRRLQQRRQSVGGIDVVIDYQNARHVALGGAFVLRPGLCRRMRAHDGSLNESSRDAGAGCGLRSSESAARL